MYYNQLGEGIVKGFRLLCLLVIIFVPLGLWKLIDIVIWICTHISISYQ